jgi:DNA-binding response OmpR family regulator
VSNSDLPGRIVVVDDDPTVADVVGRYLVRDGHTVECVHDGQEALRRIAERQPDLVVLDLMLPGLHGRDVCRAIRTHSTVPIVMLTALDDERDVVEGLDLGADDYVTKPFRPAELVARVRAHLRRAGGPAALSREIEVGGLVLRPEERIARLDGQELELRTKEFDLLLALAARPGSVLRREQLLHQVWGRDYDEDSRTIDVHINRLRSRLAGSDVEIETVRGVGYRLVKVRA